MQRPSLSHTNVVVLTVLQIQILWSMDGCMSSMLIGALISGAWMAPQPGH